ncbi:T9SS type A sorting domain-containing protein [Xanthovirga aplysinae]|uniref:T9SS type A sorting domain-containing protein n=1 Tax=Xanthovirga aplysinae TaxID=2529853 RepID=UPI0012BD62C7|nr:T9SS type A sorting domain-containing protein [Xanthovirga aplysinae]MTI33309.1 T9SS type A sorting domain-containing protein [Xanthovirga aplysinae]
MNKYIYQLYCSFPVKDKGLIKRPDKNFLKRYRKIGYSILVLFLLLGSAKLYAQEGPSLGTEPDIILNEDIEKDTVIMALNTINSSSRIVAPSSVVFKAGEKVFLKNGFKIQEGSYFLGQVGPVFTASELISDAYIDLEWYVNADYLDLPNDNGTVHVVLLDENSGEEVYREEVYVLNIKESGQLIGYYRHFVGDNQGIDYRMNLYLEGAGEEVLESMDQSGRTLAFLPPIVTVSEGNFTHKVEIELQNHSDLISEYRIYRIDGDDEQFLGSLTGNESFYEDSYTFSNENSLINGVEYSYRIVPYSERFERFYPELEQKGSTHDIKLIASDQQEESQVDLNWENVAEFADEIRVTRDEITLQTIPASSTFFTDVQPTFGKNHQYGVVLVKDETDIVAAYDQGGVKANGLISGRVITTEGDFGVPGVEINLQGIVEGEQMEKSTTTDETGFYSFPELYYGEETQFTITASLEGHSFSENEQSLTLTRQQPTVNEVNFGDDFQFEAGGLALEYSNFEIITNPEAGAVFFQGDVTVPQNGESVYLKLYRNGDLIEFIDFELNEPGRTYPSVIFADSTGIPGQNYDYTVQAYIQDGDAITEASHEGSTTYPFPAQVRAADIIGHSNSNLGRVELNWTYEQQALPFIDGYHIYRNGELLIVLDDPHHTTFDDFSGMPGTSYEYAISAFVNREGESFESTQTLIPVVQYPTLPLVTAVNAQAVNQQDRVDLNWEFPAVPSNYNYEGVNIYRDGELIVSVLKDFPGTYSDQTGIPGENHRYEFKTFKNNDPQVDESNPVSLSKTFPAVKAAENFSASDNLYTGFVELQWEHQSDNHQGFILYRNNDEITTLPAGSRSYKDVLNGPATQYTYKVKAFTKKEDNLYLSSAQSDNGSPKSDGGSAFPTAPEDFVATDDLAAHVLLQWQYPQEVLAQFEIYRDEVLLTTLATDNRLFYDYEAIPDQQHVYQIRAIYEEQPSYLAGDLGGLASTNQLSGMVTTREGGYGIPNVQISLSADLQENQYFQKVVTDSSGFYKVEGIPFQEGLQINVQAQLQNHHFEEDQQQFRVEEGREAYELNFLDLASVSIVSGDSVALPIDLVATPNHIEQNIGLRWNVNSANYSGFKLYRGLEEIADISSQHPRLVVDEEGFPGFDYTYQIQAYWDTPQGRQVSAFTTVSGHFPQVPAVEHLLLLALDKEDKVQISWSHPSNKHDYYEIKRGDEILGLVQTGEELIFVDNDGIPGQLYHYTVTAIKSVGDNLFLSDPVSQTLKYPLVSPVMDPGVENPVGENYIVLNWSHHSNNVTGYLIQRDGIVIDSLDFEENLNSYVDKEGIPGQNQEYRIISYIIIEDQTYESVPVKVEVDYPDLQVPTAPTLVSFEDEGVLNLEWQYAPEYVEGFNIYRNGELIGLVSSDQPFVYLDNNGTPEEVNTYHIAAFDVRGNQTFESPLTSFSNAMPYPKVPAPFISRASYGEFIHFVELEWNFEPTNEDGFYIYRGGKIIATVPSGKRKFKDVIDEVQRDGFNYAVQAFRIINSQEYRSELSNYETGNTNFNDIVAGENKFSDFSASQGDYTNKVRVNWVYQGGLNELKIYRDDIFLETVSSSQGYYDDLEAIPGKEYVYRVSAEMRYNVGHGPVTQIESTLAAKGFRAANGTIRGSVVTQNGAIGVPEVEIKATALIDGERHSYTAKTDVEGDFEFLGVFYDENADYEVSVTSVGHQLLEERLVAQLGTDEKLAQLAPFVDQTSYVIRGIAHRKDVSCGINDLEVTLITRDVNGNEIRSESPTTNDEGMYSFAINPLNKEVGSYSLSIADQKEYFVEDAQQTAYYQFEQSQWVITNSLDLPMETVIDFVETTTYPVQISIGSVCGTIGTNKYDLRVSAKDNCFSQTFQSDENGNLTLNLPPLDYKFTVTGVDQPTTGNLAVVDYLRVRSLEFDLLSVHQQIESEELSWEEVEGDLDLNFTFHKTPEIHIGGLEEFLCGDPAFPALMEQGKAYTLDISVSELFEDLCEVNEGFLVIKNQAAEEQNITLPYDDETQSFPAYSFVAGEPNTISPHTLNLTVEYHTENGGFQGEEIQQIVVLGQKSPPGNDVIVEVDRTEGGQVQLPLFVLRDPPGDGSFSYVEEGYAFEKTLTVSDMNSGSGGVLFNGSFSAFGIGIVGETETRAGGGEGESASFTVSTSTTERIQTSSSSEIWTTDDNFLISEAADVIVGAGLAAAYGITEKITLDDECNIVKSSLISLSSNQIKTKWIYTVKQVEELILGYERQLEELEEGTFSIEGLTKQAAHDYLTVLKENWDQVLKYHRNETVPHCNVCDVENLPEPFKTAVKGKAEYNEFCDKVRIKDESGEYILNPDFVWTEADMETYNKLSLFKADLEDYIAFTYVDRAAIKEGVSEAVNITDEILNNVDLDGEYNALYGPKVENIEFSGGFDEYANEVAIAKSSLRGYQQQTFFESENFIGVLYQIKTNAVTTFGLGVQTGISTEVVESEERIGLVWNYNFEFEKEKENTEEVSATVGYVLADDDAGDKFNVTVVRGISPSHTPYFGYVEGGRSSCPWEPNTIPRDIPLLTLEREDGSFVNNRQDNVDPEGAALFPLKLSSGNTFGEDRWYQLYVAENANSMGAVIKVNGMPLTTQEFLIPAQESIYVTLSVEKGLASFDYDDLEIGLTAACEDTEQVILPLEAYFRRPCSGVSILSDGNLTTEEGKWLIRKVSEGESESLGLKLVDYDPYNEILQEIHLQYRLVGESEWNTITSYTKADLVTYFETYQSTYPEPTLPYTWDITELDLRDGNYEVRAVSQCAGGESTSNKLAGIVDRTSIRLIGDPEPADRILSLGDEISFTFNELIEQNAFNPADVNLETTDGVPVSMNAGVIDQKVIITMDGPTLNELDGQSLIARVEKVQDIYGNALEEEVSWEFKVQQSPVYWYPEILEVDIVKGESKIIEAPLHNSSENDYTFEISELEATSWLTTSQNSGVVYPSGFDLPLTIESQSLELGLHETSIAAQISGFQDQVLQIRVNVLQKSPSWEVDDNAFGSSMIVKANFKIDEGETSMDNRDQISVWIGNEIRGAAYIQEISDGIPVASLTIGGNLEDVGHELEFRVWDASEGVEYDGHPQSMLTFEEDGIKGTSRNPEILQVRSNQDEARYIPLQAGWNWISFNTELVNNDINYVLRTLNPSPDDHIETRERAADFHPEQGWISQDGLDQLHVEKGYKLHLAQVDTLRISGAPASADPVFLAQGWNLIGYPLLETHIPEDVLQINPLHEGALLKDANSNAEYFDGRWNGTLSQLQPYHAYEVNVSESAILTYSNGNPGIAQSSRMDSETEGIDYTKRSPIEDWQVDPTDYRFNMTIVGELSAIEDQLPSEGSIVAAFVGEECRGLGQLIYQEKLHKYLLNAFVYANQSEGEKLHFKIYDASNGKIYHASNRETFGANQLVGSLSQPYQFKSGMLAEFPTDLLQVSPNPFSTETTISYTVPEKGLDVRLEVYNMLGRRIAMLINNSNHEAGLFQREFQADGLTAGIYIIKMKVGDQLVTEKVIVR